LGRDGPFAALGCDLLGGLSSMNAPLITLDNVTIAYDRTNPMPPMFCYLKPYYNNVNKSYFRQLADGEL